MQHSQSELVSIISEMESLKFIDYGRVLTLSEKAQRLAETLNEPELLARAFNGAAGAFNMIGQLDHSTENVMRAIHLAQLHNLPIVEGWALTVLSANFQYTRDYSSARQLLDRQREIARLVNDDAMYSATLSDLGHMYLSLNDTQKSIDVLQEGLEYARPEFYNGAIRSVIHINLAMAYSEVGEQALMEEHGRAGIQWSQTARSRDMLATAYLYLANGHIRFKNYEHSLTCLNEAYAVIQQIHTPWLTLSYLDTRGKLQTARGEIEDAIQILEEALTIAHTHQLFEPETQIYESLIQTHQANRDLEAVFRYQKLLHQTSEKANYHNFEKRLDILRTIFSTSINCHYSALEQLPEPAVATEEVYGSDEIIEDDEPPTRLRKEILTRLSHEFRTPLTIIGTGADLLTNYYDRLSDAQRRKHLERIRERVNWMTTKLDDILLLLKLNHNDHQRFIQEVDVQAHIEQVQQEIEHFYGDVNRVKWHVAEGLTQFATDPELLQEIFIQLISNALKFSSDVVNVSLQQQAAQLIIQVNDTGIGIPPDEIGRVQEIFYRATNLDEVPGYGIGLAIVNQVVIACEGQWHITSELNVGTQVEIIIPMPGNH